MARIKDIIGQKFGKLTAIEPTERRSNGNFVWKCKCDCGIFLKYLRDLPIFDVPSDNYDDIIERWHTMIKDCDMMIELWKDSINECEIMLSVLETAKSICDPEKTAICESHISEWEMQKDKFRSYISDWEKRKTLYEAYLNEVISL